MYNETLVNITNLVKSYKSIRETGSILEIQELRDSISEQLFFFGEIYANIRSNAEKADSDYKTCLEEKRRHWKQKLGKERGAAGLAENEAFIECEELMDELNNRNRDFYLAKSLIERSEQILNSLSSRIKIVGKHE